MDTQNKPNRPVKVYVIDPTIKLTTKQAWFVYEYLKDGNATQAAFRAGYSEKCVKQQGTENLAKPSIKQAIDDGKWFYQYQNGIDADWIRKKRIELLEKCMQLEEVTVKVDGEDMRTGEYVFKDATCRQLLADMAKDSGMDVSTLNVNQSGTVQHEHTVREQMDFDEIRSKVEKHDPKRLN